MKVIVIGNSEYAQLVYSYISEDETIDVVAFSVEKEYININEINGLPVIAYEDIEHYYGIEQVKLVLAIGYAKMGKIREKLFSLYSDKGYEFINYIHPTAIIPKDLVIGVGNVIMEGAIISRQCKIGNANIIGAGMMMGHDNQIGNFNSLTSAKTCGFVTIKNNCFLGANATVRDGVIINSFSLVGALSYVDKNLAENALVSPAKSTVTYTKIECLSYLLQNHY